MARIRLDAVRTEWPSDLPEAAHRVRAGRQCELEFGHVGRHAALGRQSEELEWWIRWWSGSPDPTIEQTAVCSAGDEDPDEDAVCLLFEEHPGHHTFDLRPAGFALPYDSYDR